MKYIFLFIATLFVSPLLADQTDVVVNLINHHRLNAGLKPVTHSKKLSKGCQKHTKYLVKNNVSKTNYIDPHTEKKGKRGYSKIGKKCAENGAMISVVDPEVAVNYWISTFFHRIPFLDPHLKEVGLGTAIGGIWKRATAVDVFSSLSRGKIKPSPVMYPASKQKEVPITFGLQRKGFVIREHPNPLKEDADGIAGYPVTLSFYNYEKISLVSAQIKNVTSGNILDAIITSPKKPALTKLYQQNTICIIPSDPFKEATHYKVTIKVIVNKKQKEYKWGFDTVSSKIKTKNQKEG